MKNLGPALRRSVLLRGAAAGTAGVGGGTGLIYTQLAMSSPEYRDLILSSGAGLIAALLIGSSILLALASRRNRRQEDVPRTIACPDSLVEDFTTTYGLLTQSSFLHGELEEIPSATPPSKRRPRRSDTTPQYDSSYRKLQHALEQQRRSHTVAHFVSALQYANRPIIPGDEGEIAARDGEVRRRLEIINAAVVSSVKDSHR